jgi:hypothetical protein
MHPTIAEQLAAMHRRDLEEHAMMPYDTYRLYQIERPKTAAEIRIADERAGQLAAAAAGLVRQLARAGHRRRPLPRHVAAGRGQPPRRGDRMTTTTEIR